MAIAPKLIYPGQLDETDPTGYPHGKAQNETSPGDDDGTPLEQALVNDLLGFQQALLSEAGISPSGTPDKADASQYLDALKVIMDRGALSRLVFNNIRSIQQVANGSSQTNHAIVFSAILGFPRWFVFKEGSGGGDGNELIRADNGAGWESLNIPLTSVGNALDAASSDDKIVVATDAGDTGLAYSTTSTAFTSCTYGSFGFRTVFYTGAKFIASAVGGPLAYSADGITFSGPTTDPLDWAIGGFYAEQFARNPATGRVIGVPHTAHNRFITTDDDGDNWVSVAVPSKTWLGIACHKGVWLAINSDASNPVYKSVDDGETWTQVTGVTVLAATFSPKLFVHDGWFVAMAGSAIHYSRDGQTWHRGQYLRPVSNAAFRNWAYGGGGFCAVFQDASGPTTIALTLQSGEWT